MAPMTPQMGPEDAGRIADPAKAEEMAYAGKSYREAAVGLANNIEGAISGGETTVSDPVHLDIGAENRPKYSIPNAVKQADQYNAQADVAEQNVAEAYDKRKADAEAAAAQLAAIKAGKRIVEDQSNKG